MSTSQHHVKLVSTSLRGSSVTMHLNLQSHKIQLVLAAAAGSAATVAAFSSYHVYTRKRRRQQLREEIKEALAHEDSSIQFADPSQLQISEDVKNLISPRAEPVRGRIQRGEHPEELFREQLARCYALFKEEGMERIQSANVVVVGCGGVGSWAAVMLVRSCV